MNKLKKEVVEVIVDKLATESVDTEGVCDFNGMADALFTYDYNNGGFMWSCDYERKWMKKHFEDVCGLVGEIMGYTGWYALDLNHCTTNLGMFIVDVFYYQTLVILEFDVKWQYDMTNGELVKRLEALLK